MVARLLQMELVSWKKYISFECVGAFVNVQFSCIINVSYADTVMHGLTLKCVACAWRRNFFSKLEDTLSLFPFMLNVDMWCGALGSVIEMITCVSYFFNMQCCVWSFISLVCSGTIFSNCCVLGRLQDFYEDIFIELSKYGEIENLNVCDNLADHMVRNSCS